MPNGNKFDPADDGDWPVPKDCELIDGQFVETPSCAYRGWVSGQLLFALIQHCDSHDLGWVFPSNLGYRFFPSGPPRLRKVSCSFIRKGRFPNNRLSRGDCKIPPDLAVYFPGPDDLADFVRTKVNDFMDHGTRLMWVVTIEDRTATVVRADGSTRTVWENDELNGEDVLPGFRCRLGSIFGDDPAADEPVRVLARE